MNTNAFRQFSTHATANGSINKGCHRMTIDATGYYYPCRHTWTHGNIHALHIQCFKLDIRSQFTMVHADIYDLMQTCRSFFFISKSFLLKSKGRSPSMHGVFKRNTQLKKKKEEHKFRIIFCFCFWWIIRILLKKGKSLVQKEYTWEPRKPKL